MDSTKIKAIASVMIVVIAILATIFMGSSVDAYEKEDGLIIDFGNRNTLWTGLNLDDEDPLSCLEKACLAHNLSLSVSGDIVESIDGAPAISSSKKWGFWVIDDGKYDWRKVTSNFGDLDLSSYAAICWALCGTNEVPSPAVDYTKVNSYGYVDNSRVVSLAPSITETLCSIGAADKIVGVDLYSTYPKTIENAMELGEITSIGGYTNPSFETILSLSPSIVFCDGSIASHKVIAEKLRGAGVSVTVLYGGEDVSTILDNMLLVGASMGMLDSTYDAMEEINSDINLIKSSLSGGFTYEVLVTLDSSPSPWVAGTGTYISDVVESLYSKNVLSESGYDGWFTLSMETMGLTYDPDYIIIIYDSVSTTASESDYDALLKNVDEFWKETTAYKNGKIYWLTDEATNVGSRPGPRVSQLTELVANILYGDDMPKYIGDNYADLLTYSADLGW